MFLLLFLVFLDVASAQSPLICEDTISAQPPFNNNDIPCLLGCGAPLAQPMGSLLPGSVNTTAIPYCRLECVRTDATPAQSSLAPECNAKCENGNAATPDQLGWCMYWCVEGGDIEQLVVSTTCVPQLQYVPVKTSSIQSDVIVTIEGFSMNSAWASWYQTQTVISRSSLIPAAPVSTTSHMTTSLPEHSITTPSRLTSSAVSSSTGTLIPPETPLEAPHAQTSGSQTPPTITTTPSSAHGLELSKLIGALWLIVALSLNHS